MSTKYGQSLQYVTTSLNSRRGQSANLLVPEAGIIQNKYVPVALNHMQAAAPGDRGVMLD